MNFQKKALLPVCGILPAVALGLCTAISLSGYEAPVLTADATMATTKAEAATSSEDSSTQTTTKSARKTTTATEKPKSTVSTEAVPTVSLVEDSDSYTDGTYTGTGTGFSGPITVQVVISGGKIQDISILSSTDDTPYLTAASALLNSIVSKQSTNVDTVSGATYSSVGLIEAVRNALAKAGGSSTQDAISISTSAAKTVAAKSTTAATIATISEPSSGYLDGTYTGTGVGFEGDITVEVSIVSGKIKTISILDTVDDSPYIDSASALLQSILKLQSTNVDTVSGATYSSIGLIEAVRDALAKAQAKETTSTSTTTTAKPATTTTATTEAVSVATSTTTSKRFKDGTYTETALCSPNSKHEFSAYTVSVSVTIEEGEIKEIADVTLKSDEEDADENKWYLLRAANGTSRFPGVIAQILEKQSTEEIDAVSGATCSSEAIVEAVQAILEKEEVE